MTRLLPTEARRFQSLYPVANGPNCWNSSLALSGRQAAFRYADWSEFSRELERCEAISRIEDLAPGDIAAIRVKTGGGRFDEYHGFTWISPRIAFSKNGMTRRNAYSLQSLSGVLNFYYTSRDCFWGRNKPDCEYFVEFFRCDGLGRTAPIELDEPVEPREVVRLRGALDSAERRLSDLALGRRGVGEVGDYLLDQTLDRLEERVASLELSRSTDERRLARGLRARVVSLRIQWMQLVQAGLLEPSRLRR